MSRSAECEREKINRPPQEILINIALRIKVKAPEPTVLGEQSSGSKQVRRNTSSNSSGVQRSMNRSTTEARGSAADRTPRFRAETSTTVGQESVLGNPGRNGGGLGSLPVAEMDSDANGEAAGNPSLSTNEKSGEGGSNLQSIPDLTLEEIPRKAAAVGIGSPSTWPVHYKREPEEYGCGERLEQVVPPSSRLRKCCDCCPRRRRSISGKRRKKSVFGIGPDRTVIGRISGRMSPRRIRSISSHEHRAVKVYDDNVLVVHCTQCRKPFNVVVDVLKNEPGEDTFDAFDSGQ